MQNGVTHRQKKLADSYLDHILIALAADDRGAPFRTFLDNWYAFTVGRGHLTRGDRPVWFNNPCARRHADALSAMHFVSAAAEKIISHAASDRSSYDAERGAKDKSIRLMVDHAVPVRVVIDRLFHEHQTRGDGLTREELRTLLTEVYKLGVITSVEDDQLREAGMGAAMPRDWDGISVFARYEAAHIAASLGSAISPPS